ncbi:hypothetical protein [Phyllobacterium chamaecytisi]|uniref:hypothetical protein n=1 Tax=Phyllobacterium chamaecytisi TaxID=2876082 RepID=UPI001CCC275A|nr:hypothetical protein [Phyllobacterium sp. KW56]MBZ9605553.1 hypothetical protein [Phyllobacterium sp. KW56]
MTQFSNMRFALLALTSGGVDEKGAIDLAHQFMNANQYDFFDIELKKTRMRNSAGTSRQQSDQTIAFFDKATHSAWQANPGRYRV